MCLLVCGGELCMAYSAWGFKVWVPACRAYGAGFRVEALPQ